MKAYSDVRKLSIKIGNLGFGDINFDYFGKNEGSSRE
jgi:hypothetical protein